MLKNELLIFYPSKEYFIGETIKGYAELRIPYSLDIQGVQLKIMGTESVSKGKNNCTNTFYEKEFLLIGDGSKDRGKDWLGRTKKVSEKINQGSHQYPFQITLPTHLPPSSESNEAKIRYIIEVTVESGNSKMSNLVSASLVKVSGSLFDLNFLGNNASPFTVKETRTFFMTSKSLDISVSLESKVFLPGDSIKMKFILDNQTSKSLTKITMNLIQKTELFANGYSIDEKEDVLGSLPLGGLNGNEQKFPAQQIIIPTTAFETLSLTDLDGKKVGKCIRFSHYLNFYAEVSGLIGSEVKFTIPIFIARCVLPKENNQQQNQAPSLDMLQNLPKQSDIILTESFTSNQSFNTQQQQQQFNTQQSFSTQQQFNTQQSFNTQQQQQPQLIQPVLTTQNTQQEHQSLYPTFEINLPPLPKDNKKQYDEFFQ